MLDTDTVVNGGSAEDIDWSKPVSSSLKTESSEDFDWSKPVSKKLGKSSYSVKQVQSHSQG